MYVLTHEYNRKGTTSAYRKTDQKTVSLQTKNECKIVYARIFENTFLKH